MAYANSEGARIYYEETGSGTPILFLHEFAGDFRSWADQIRHLARGWRCITMSARGYPPSDVPAEESAYGQDIANRDAIAVLDHLKIDRAHVVGLSMGAYTALQLAVHFPERVRAAVPCGGGSGSYPPQRAQFIRDSIDRAAAFEKAGKIPAEAMGLGPTRVQLLNKDPIGWRIATEHQASHPA
ncbi:MAG TPA: alpha/beta fold hydrolase, partial [Ilumatobacteraceae bacterium]|nr:alpha/beta fold hydrolase [Ilumatobacteraceae bacterium]